MAYTPTNWVTGQTPLSAANLNNIEQGISDLNSKAIPDSRFQFLQYLDDSIKQVLCVWRHCIY